MQYDTIFLIVQFLIYWNQINFTSGKALIGQNVRRADYLQYPFIVCIAGTDDPIMEENIWCTGSLVSFFHVLSSEHCVSDVENEPYRMIVGSNDLYRGSSFFPAWWVSYDSWSNSGRRRLVYNLNDIAMIKLIGTVYPLVSRIATITPLTTNANIIGLQGVSVGWGTLTDDRMPTFLKVANVTMISKTQCEDAVEVIARRRLPLNDRYMCSRAHPYVHLGEGDSGGPLFYDGYIVAINKATCPNVEEFHAGVQNVHIFLDYYRAFITDTSNLH